MLARFWNELEREARPHVEQELAKRGWVLLNGTAHTWRARRVKEVEGWGRPVVRAVSASSLIEAVVARDQAIRSLEFADSDDVVAWEWD